jgi:hypothetical protein
MPHDPEICICAAIRLPDGRIFRGHRHSDAMRTAIEYIEYRHKEGYERSGWSSEMADEQGFMTSHNRFVDRDEGFELQLAAGIRSAAKDGYRSTLFSEDLY